MQSIILQIVGLLIIVVLLILFFSKPNINNIETKTYSKLILLNFLFIVVGILTYVVAKITGNLTLVGIFQKVYMSLLALLNLYSIHYCMSIYDKEKRYTIFKKISVIITGITILLIVVLPLNAIFEENILDGEGLSYDVVIIHTVLSFIFFVIVSIYLILKKHSITKISPYIILIILYIVGFLIRNYYKELTFEGFFYSYILFIMYHTIENPDVKILNEYIKNKELTQISIEEKFNTLFKISQDVKSPINKITVLSKKILDNDDINFIHEEVKKIEIEAINVAKVINTVLDITQMDIDNIKIIDNTYNIYNLFNQVVYLTKNNIKESVEYRYSINNTIPISLHGDSTKLKQVICSIIFNAINNTEKGFIDLDINSIVKYDLCRLIITISDSGKGIELAKINEILASNEVDEKEVYNLDNLDIDLKITKKIINLMGGNLLIKSEINHGTSFIIIIDQLIENNKQENSVELEKLTLNLSNKKKVLVVTDDYRELELLTTELKKNGINVVRTMNSKDCIDKIKNGEIFDLILLDDEMEPMNAIETLTEINKLKKQNKVVVMLNKQKQSFKENYLEDYPFVDYLLKNDYKNEVKRIKEKYLL